MTAFMWVMLGSALVTAAMLLGDWVKDHRPVLLSSRF